MPPTTSAAKLCFVSYASEHKAHARFLERLLQSLFPETLRVFVASTSLAPSSDWYQEVVERLREAHFVLLLLTPSVISRPWLLFESGAAVALNVKLFPLRFCDLPTQMLPSPLARYTSADLTQHSNVEAWLKEMVTALPPKEEQIRAVALKISAHFQRVRQNGAEPPLTGPLLQTPEYRISLLARLSETQRALFFYVLTWQAKDGVLESAIRAGHFIRYWRHAAQEESQLPISASEYYYRLRDLYSKGLLDSGKVDAVENRWWVRPEIVKLLPPPA
jgi:hypothetical protein